MYSMFVRCVYLLSNEAENNYCKHVGLFMQNLCLTVVVTSQVTFSRFTSPFRNDVY